MLFLKIALFCGVYFLLFVLMVTALDASLPIGIALFGGIASLYGISTWRRWRLACQSLIAGWFGLFCGCLFFLDKRFHAGPAPEWFKVLRRIPVVEPLLAGGMIVLIFLPLTLIERWVDQRRSMNATAVPRREHCEWHMDGARRIGVEVWENEKVARLEVDPADPHRLALAPPPNFWRVVCVHPRGHPGPFFEHGSHFERDGEHLSDADIERVMRKAVRFLADQGLSPVVVAHDEAGQPPRQARWLDLHPGIAASTEVITDLEWKRDVRVAPRIDRTAFGTDLMTHVAQRLIQEREARGLRENHPEYCGHGLVYRNGRFELVVVCDGHPTTVLGHWSSEQEFVAFFAPLSDWTCSGSDPTAPLFRANSAWELDNQRLTRSRLESYAKVR